MAIATSQLYLITSCEKKTKDVWDAWREHFERDTSANEEKKGVADEL